MSDTPEFRELLSALRGEIRETRDAVMAKIGGLESAYRHLTSEVTSTKTIAQRAESLAIEAKRDADMARTRMVTTEESLKLHVDRVADLAKGDRDEMKTKADEVLKEIQQSRAIGQARSQLRLEEQAREAEAILRTERRKKHVLWGLGVLFSVAQIVQLYTLIWRSIR